MTDKRLLTHGGLFSGIGGFSEGFRRNGIKTTWEVEIDQQCRRVLRHHDPDVQIENDVTEAGAHNLPPVDIISFGSPCQDLSVAGNQRGLNGERSGLYYEAVRIIDELRPAIAIWENVPGAFSSNRGYDFAAAVDALAEIGALDISWRVLDARYFGVAQRRRRVFLIADFTGERAGEILFEPAGGSRDTAASRATGPGIARTLTAGSNGNGRRQEDDFSIVSFHNRQDPDISGDVTHPIGVQDNGMAILEIHENQRGEVRLYDTASSLNTRGGKPGQGYSAVLGFMGGQGSKAGSLGIEEETAPTLKGAASGTNQAPAIQTGATVRRLTPTECCRLQGFRDDWLDIDPPLADTPKYRMLGNAVCVNVTQWIGKRIVEAMDDCP